MRSQPPHDGSGGRGNNGGGFCFLLSSLVGIGEASLLLSIFIYNRNAELRMSIYYSFTVLFHCIIIAHQG